MKWQTGNVGLLCKYGAIGASSTNRSEGSRASQLIWWCRYTFVILYTNLKSPCWMLILGLGSCLHTCISSVFLGSPVLNSLSKNMLVGVLSWMWLNAWICMFMPCTGPDPGFIPTLNSIPGIGSGNPPWSWPAVSSYYKMKTLFNDKILSLALVSSFREIFSPSLKVKQTPAFLF